MTTPQTLDPRNFPDRIRVLRRDERGYPVPWFVHWQDGAPDFRVVAAGKVAQAIKLNLCWICGNPLGRNMAFLIGPLGSINRCSAEPPSHPSCAMFAAKTCPFLMRPQMRRNDRDMPPGSQPAPGEMLLHNPGVCCTWITRHFRLMPVDNGVLFRIGEPIDVHWFCRGQLATRGEVVQAMDKGLPILIDEAKEDSDEAVQALLQAINRMRQYLPPGGKDDEPGSTAKRQATHRASAA